MKRLSIAICLVAVVAMLLPSLAEAHGGRRGRVQVNVGHGFRQQVFVQPFRQRSVFINQPQLFYPQSYVQPFYGYGVQQQVIVGGGACSAFFQGY